MNFNRNKLAHLWLKRIQIYQLQLCKFYIHSHHHTSVKLLYDSLRLKVTAIEVDIDAVIKAT
ncbi:hypothetical protein T10_3870 [Trichinella papuae]|uniref:Uncharacterized protein n=1 Tax=Trichinella papuae TaxID=268474 RepID=A0A0V1N0T8_9BILA|nr:hypothetical protein T10_3870 [Trichinella papuae]